MTLKNRVHYARHRRYNQPEQDYHVGHQKCCLFTEDLCMLSMNGQYVHSNWSTRSCHFPASYH